MAVVDCPDIHFISGLPRSGTTLLAALLGQNPSFSAGMSGPTAGLIKELLVAINYKNQFHRQVTTEQKRAIAEGIFSAFYGRREGVRVAFDTSRKWTAMLPFVTSLFPAAWIFCCVRNVGWILDSYERVIRANAPAMPTLIPAEAASNMQSRVDYLASPFGEVGKCLSSVAEAFHGEESGRVVLIRYETLAASPIACLKRIYDLIGAPWFPHDPDNVKFSDDEFDASVGASGLHRVRPEVRLTERTSVLPPPLFAALERRAFWNDPNANVRKVPIW